MSLFESVQVALFCMVVVFVVLAVLFVIIRLFSVGIGTISAKNTSPIPLSVPISEASVPKIVTQTESEMFSSGTLKLKDVDEQTAAMIMAIVSDDSGIPLSELCFKSIRLIKE
jgi:hypothetical protein